MCVGVAKVTTRGEQHVPQTINSLLDGLSQDERHSLYLNIPTGYTDPSKHPTFAGPKPPEQGVKNKMPDFARMQQWEEGGWHRNETTFEYTCLLNDCYANGALAVAGIQAH
jgi:hypothetical protein